MHIPARARNGVRNLVLCVLAFCALGSSVRAQKQSKSLLPVLEQAQRQNWMLRFDDTDGHATQGRIVDRSDTLVRVGRSAVDLNNVKQVSRGLREGGASMHGAIAGGAVFGMLGLLFVSALCQDGDSGHVGGCASQIVLGTAMTAGFGSIIGLLLGEAANPAHLEWKQVWP